MRRPRRYERDGMWVEVLEDGDTIGTVDFGTPVVVVEHKTSAEIDPSGDGIRLRDVFTFEDPRKLRLSRDFRRQLKAFADGLYDDLDGSGYIFTNGGWTIPAEAEEGTGGNDDDSGGATS